MLSSFQKVGATNKMQEKNSYEIFLDQFRRNSNKS